MLVECSLSSNFSFIAPCLKSISVETWLDVLCRISRGEESEMHVDNPSFIPRCLYLSMRVIFFHRSSPRISTRARARVLLSLRRGPSDAAQHPNRRRTIIFETKIRCHAFVKAAAAVHTEILANLLLSHVCRHLEECRAYCPFLASRSERKSGSTELSTALSTVSCSRLAARIG